MQAQYQNNVQVDIHSALARELNNPSIGGKIWLDHPSYLYSTEQQAETYIDLLGDEIYAQPVHAPIKSLFSEYRTDILSALVSPIDIIDLGPGFPDITLPLLDELVATNACARYVPVDISSDFLKISCEAVSRYEITCIPVNCFFEEFSQRLQGDELSCLGSRLIIIGVTFLNYRPKEILPLLKGLCRPEDACMIAAQITDNTSRESLLRPYLSQGARQLNWAVIDALGIEPSAVEYVVEFGNGRIEMGFRLLRSIETRTKLQIHANQTIITAISYRYSRGSFLKTLLSEFRRVHIYDDPEKKAALAKCII